MQGKVLVVEDMPDWRKRFIRILEKDGHTVRNAANYDKAVSLLQKDGFDVVILDLRLVNWDDTDFSGMNLLDEIDKVKEKQGTNVIIVTGYGRLEHSREGFKKYEIFDFLEKANFNAREFEKTVRVAVEDAYDKKREVLSR